MPRKMIKEINTAKLRNQLSMLIAAKEIRDGRKYTRGEIAEITGVSLGAVQRMINNQTDQYDGAVVVKLCEWLGITPSVFFGTDYEDFRHPLSANASMSYAAGYGV